MWRDGFGNNLGLRLWVQFCELFCEDTGGQLWTAVDSCGNSCVNNVVGAVIGSCGTVSGTPHT